MDIIYHQELKHLELKKDELLYFNYMGLKYFPCDLLEKAYHSDKITRIYMQRNCLTKIPDEIAFLSNLVEINLSQNKLTELSDGICDIKNLKCLDLKGNHLQTLPLRFHNLSKLTRLGLSSNSLKSFPKVILNLRNLLFLDLMDNQLKELPNNWSLCQNLQHLLLDRNKLHWLPQQLCKVDSLEEVSVAGNCLLCLPMDIGYMKSLKTLYVDNNPHLHAIPDSLQSQELGFSECGKYNFEPYSYESRNYSYIIVYSDTENEAKHVYLPKEMEFTEKIERSSLSLFEIVIRKMYELGSSLKIQFLPAAMQYIVENPFSWCSMCHSAIFTMFYVIVFRNRSKSNALLRLICYCSIRCAKRANSSRYFDPLMKIYTIVKRNNLSEHN